MISDSARTQGHLASRSGTRAIQLIPHYEKFMNFSIFRPKSEMMLSRCARIVRSFTLHPYGHGYPVAASPLARSSARIPQTARQFCLSKSFSFVPLNALSRDRHHGSFYISGPAISRGFAATSVSQNSSDDDPAKWILDGARSALDKIQDAGKQAGDAISPYLDKFNSSPQMMEIFVPTCTALGGCAAAWFILPKLLRKLHYYVEQGPTARLLGRPAQEQVPYEKSMWNALEDPARLFTTVIFFTQLGALISPRTIAEQYLGHIWHGGFILSILWFLHRWKSIVFSRLLVGRTMTKAERERYLALEKVSSVGLILLGTMALAEASGVAVQSILTVGGIGGIATAFAARDILGNAFSGLALQFLKPFSIGDSIKAGSVEGQVIEMGLHSTQLLNADKCPVIVPNSFFSSQVIVNKSRIQWKFVNCKLPVRIDAITKLPSILKEVTEMLKAHPQVSTSNGVPQCYISKIEPTHVEVTLSCNIKPTEKNEALAVEQEILMDTVFILHKADIMSYGVPGSS